MHVNYDFGELWEFASGEEAALESEILVVLDLVVVAIDFFLFQWKLSQSQICEPVQISLGTNEEVGKVIDIVE